MPTPVYMVHQWDDFIKMTDDKKPSARFVETARDLECDEDEYRFSAKLRRAIRADNSEKQRLPED
ncbi:MAG: hypothetical protein OXH09_07105 [Gammaproteobacteria bacterium]|nr:hypothetical protein [Gammaproteobacteria bacterium]